MRWRITWRDQYPQSNVTKGGRLLTVATKHAWVTKIFPATVDESEAARLHVKGMKGEVRRLRREHKRRQREEAALALEEGDDSPDQGG